MKKKLLAIGMVAALGTTAIGGTLAYFTDTDSAKNVMTTGKVAIKQIEEKRLFNDNGEFWTLSDFEDNVALMPAVYDYDEIKNEFMVTDSNLGWRVYNSKVKNAVDKFVRVINVAEPGAVNQDAYVRTLIAFETQRHYEEGSSTEFNDMHETYIGVNGTLKYVDVENGDGKNIKNRRYFTVDGVEYVLAECVYEKALVPEEASEPSLRQVFLSPDANNEVADIFGSEYTILCLSQATQTAGFASAEEALDTVFGDLSEKDTTSKKYVSDEKLIEWFKNVE